MDESFIDSQARDDFNKAKLKAWFKEILAILKPEKNELLSFHDIKSLVKPKAENYRGMQVVPVSKIVGSEDRYHDFNKTFLPRKEHLRFRWQRVDRAHIEAIILPPIRVFKLGEVYFVRDGNHRVSVARLQGVESIDAEVVELTTELSITGEMDRDEMKRKVIEFERNKVLKDTGIDRIISMDDIYFTAPGRYEEMLRHILGHQYFMGHNMQRNISFEEAVHSWHDTLYSPICKEIEARNMLARFKGRTKGDLYMWIVKHWDSLKKKYGQHISIRRASSEYLERFGERSMIHRLKKMTKKIFRSKCLGK